MDRERGRGAGTIEVDGDRMEEDGEAISEAGTMKEGGNVINEVGVMKEEEDAISEAEDKDLLLLCPLTSVLFF